MTWHSLMEATSWPTNDVSSPVGHSGRPRRDMRRYMYQLRSQNLSMSKRYGVCVCVCLCVCVCVCLCVCLCLCVLCVCVCMYNVHARPHGKTNRNIGLGLILRYEPNKSAMVAIDFWHGSRGSILPSIVKAYRPNKPSVHTFF